MMNKKYFITLSPLDWFFFGGEKTLGEDEKAQYLARSNYYPQQSSILGMLRYQLLKQYHLLNEDIKIEDRPEKQKKAGVIEQLIGKSSFNMANRSEGFTFGQIKKISPLSIYNCQTENFYLPLPLDEGYQINFTNSAKISLNGIIKEKLIKATNFDHKSYCNFLLWKNVSSAEVVKTKDIWLNKTQIGITKMQAGDPDNEKNFYKQEILRLREKFVFAFWVELGESLITDKIFLGGQRSVFDMQVQEVTQKEDVDVLFKNKAVCFSHSTGKITLLSDTFIENIQELNQLCNFQWSYSIPFRNIETTINDNNYSKKPGKSEFKYHFFQRGSVLYFDENKREDVEKIIDNVYLQSVGYNIYK